MEKKEGKSILKKHVEIAMSDRLLTRSKSGANHCVDSGSYTQADPAIKTGLSDD